MRKIITRALVALALTGGALAVPAVAEAGTGANHYSCDQSANLGTRVCIDVSLQTARVYSGATTVYAATSITPALTGANPSSGWIAWDFECNAGGGNVTTFPTGLGQTVSMYLSLVPGNHWWWVNPLPSQSFADTVAWVVNSNTGYECVIVP